MIIRLVLLHILVLCVAAVVDADERVEMARMCSAQMQSNYQKIKTWSGHVVVTDVARVGISDEGPRLFVAEADAEFMVDLASDSLYSSYRRTKHGTYSEPSGQISEADASGYFHDSIITPVHFLHSNPESFEFSRFREELAMLVEGYKTNRVILIDDPDTGRDFTDGSMVIDPRTSFTFGNRNFWKILEIYAGWIDKGRLVSVEMSRLSTPVNGVRFRQTAPDGTATETVFDKDSGWNLASGITKSADGFSSRLSVEYQLVDGIFVPLKYDRVRQNTEGILSERHMHFSTPVLNQPIDESTFSVTQLVPDDGTRVADRIQNKEFRIWHGDLVPENEFAELVIAEARANSPKRRFLIWNAVLAALLLTVFVMQKLRRHPDSNSAKPAGQT